MEPDPVGGLARIRAAGREDIGGAFLLALLPMTDEGSLAGEHAVRPVVQCGGPQVLVRCRGRRASGVDPPGDPTPVPAPMRIAHRPRHLGDLPDREDVLLRCEQVPGPRGEGGSHQPMMLHSWERRAGLWITKVVSG